MCVVVMISRFVFSEKHCMFICIQPTDTLLVSMDCKVCLLTGEPVDLII